MAKFLRSIIFLIGLIFVVLALLTFRAQSLDDIELGESPSLGAVHSLSRKISKAAKNRQRLEITEAELNRFLSDALEGKQEGLFSSYISFKQVVVRIEEGRIHIIVERELLNRWPHTVSAIIGTELVENQKRLAIQGGQLGQLSVNQGVLNLVLSSFQNLSKAFSGELDMVIKKFGQVEFSEAKITLLPQERKIIQTE